jgi:hypothetical protein
LPAARADSNAPVIAASPLPSRPSGSCTSIRPAPARAAARASVLRTCCSSAC